MGRLRKQTRKNVWAKKDLKEGSEVNDSKNVKVRKCSGNIHCDFNYGFY